MTKFIKPAKVGLLVRYQPPSTSVLSADGKLVVWNSWWSSKLKEGDIEIVTAVVEMSKPTPEEEAQ